MPTCVKCHSSFKSLYVDEKGKEHNFQRRKYCISCSPIYQHNTRKLEVCTQDEASSRKCLFCDGKSGKRRKTCLSCHVKIVRFKIKSRAIKHLGGKCVDCGWSGHLAGFQFHHKDGDKKFGIGGKARKWEDIVDELNKCELLCAICHRIRHCNASAELLKFCE